MARTGIELAEAYVSLTVSSDKVAGEVREQMGAAGAQGGTKGGAAAQKGFAKSFSSGIGAKIATGLAAAKIGSMVKDSILGAADLEQSTGAVDAVFKETAGSMHDLAAGASESVGIAKHEYNELATVIGSQLKNVGMDLDKVDDKTAGLITTGSDLSAMFGGSTADAVGALSSALKGEMDPIERYGITLNEAALEAEAMRMGILKPVTDAAKVKTAMEKITLAQRRYSETVKKNGAESTQAAGAKITLAAAERAYDKATAGKIPKLNAHTKALAVMSAIETQSADAKGTFSRETDTVSHKTQVLSAKIKTLSADLGTSLLPVVAAVTGALIVAVGFMAENEWAVVALASVVGGLLTMAFISWTASIWGTTAALLASPVTWIVLAIVALIAGIIYLATQTRFFQATWEIMSAAWSASCKWMGEAWNNTTDWILRTTTTILDGFGFVFGGIGDFVGGVFAGIKSGAVDFFNYTTGGLNQLIELANAASGLLSKGTGGLISLPKIGKIPGLATGGTVTGSGTVMVGERGPELLNLGRGASVIPLDHPAADTGSGTTLNYYAAENRSFDAEAELQAALGKTTLLGR